MVNRKGILLGCVFWGLAVADSAQAQETGVQPGPQEQVSTADIIVTAQKREISAQKLPSTVAVLSGEQLENLQVKTFENLNALVPGYSFERTNGGNQLMTIRGVGTNSAGQSLEQSVSAYINGVYAGGSQREFLSPIYDVERIEVLKGTQSGITGQNTSVGVINIVTRGPGQDFGGYLKLGHEFSYNGWNAEGAVDIPFSDKFQARVTGFYQHDGGYLNNVRTGNKPGESTFYSGRVNAVWQATDTVRVKLYGQYDDNFRLGSTLVSFGPVDPVYASYFPDGLEPKTTDVAKYSSRDLAHDGDEYVKNTNIRGSVAVDVDVGDSTLTSVTAVSRIHDYFFTDSDGDVRDSQVFINPARYNQVHQEIRLVSPTGDRFSYIVGAWYRHAKMTRTFLAYLDPDIFAADIRLKQITNNFSVFGDAQYKLTDALKIGGSLRWTTETKTGTHSSDSNWPFVFTASPETTGKLKPRFLDGSARIQYEPTDDLNFYASFAHGTKTGAFTDIAASLLPVKPEKAKTYEVGAKLRIPDARLNLTASLYRMDVKGFQDVYVQTVAGLTTIVAANRDLWTEGLEFSADWRPADGLSIGITGLLMKSRDETGGDVVRSPHVALNGNFRYEVPLGGLDATFAFFGAASYRSKYFSNAFDLANPVDQGAAYRELSATPKYALLDLGVEVAQDTGYSVKLLVKNVTNTYTRLAPALIQPQGAAGPFYPLGNQLPLRQFFLEFGYKF